MTLQDPKNTTKSTELTLLKDYVDTAPTGSDNISCDTKGWRFAKIIFCAGTLTGGTSWTGTVQQSSDNGSVDSFANIESSPTAKTQAVFLAANDQTDKIVVIDLASVERYLKISWAKSGTFTVSQLAVRIELYGPCDTALLGSEVDGFYP